MELQQRGHVSEIRVRCTCLVQQDKVKTCISKGFEREDATLPTGVIVPLSFVKITHGAPGEKGSHEQSECSPTTVDHDTWTKLRVPVCDHKFGHIEQGNNPFWGVDHFDPQPYVCIHNLAVVNFVSTIDLGFGATIRLVKSDVTSKLGGHGYRSWLSTLQHPWVSKL